MAYDFQTTDGKYWYAEPVKANHDDIFWRQFVYDLKTSLPSFSSLFINPPGFSGQFIMEFTSELGASAESQVRQAYQDYDTLTTSVPWYERHLDAKWRAFIEVTADLHSITPEAAYTALRNKYLEITGFDPQ
jgi:hypothetical protein